MEITRDIAEKVLALIDCGLVAGKGIPEPGRMCIEAVWCYALGLPHGDDPGCVAASLRTLKITLNDMSWSSPQTRAKGLRRLGLAQAGSAGVLDEQEFVKRVALMVVQQMVPRALRAITKMAPRVPEFQALEAAALACDGACDISAARGAAKSAWSAAEKAAESAWNAAESAWCAAERAAAESAAGSARSAAERAALSVSWSAAESAQSAAEMAAAESADSSAAEKAAESAWCAALSVSWSAAESARSAAADAELTFFTEQVVQILIAMNAPGCQWLDLTES